MEINNVKIVVLLILAGIVIELIFGQKEDSELYNDMIDSVTIYEGFYIGRYETGNLSQAEVVVIKNNTDIANQTWYTKYNKSNEYKSTASI